VAEGSLNREIPARSWLSEPTVKSYVDEILQHLAPAIAYML